MIKYIIILLGSFVVGGSFGFALCHIGHKAVRQRVRKLQRLLFEERQARKGEKKKMGVMDMIILYEVIFLTLYTVASFVMFWCISAEPSTLTTCVFAFWGSESGFLALLKRNKDKLAAVPSPEKNPEPSDAGEIIT